MKRIKKFFKVLSLYIFCLKMISQGHSFNNDKLTVSSFRELWHYCEAWENGNL